MKRWYCYKCRDEVIKEYPQSWWLLNYPNHPIKELTKDPEKPGYYVCPRHAKETLGE